MKVLVVRFAAIGDCVMTAWAVTALRQAAPTARITWAVQSRCAPVIYSIHLVDSIHEVTRERWKAQRWSPATWHNQMVTYTHLRKVGFDVGFDFQGHSKTALMLRLAGCKRRLASRATDRFAAALNPPETGLAGTHEVELAHSLVCRVVECRLPERPLMPRVAGSADNPKLVTIQTGAGENDKTYPVDQWAKIADQMVQKGFRVVALGGPGDPPLKAASENLVGSLALPESMSWIARSAVHLAADTGTGHIAAAYGVPVVSVFGRTDPARFRPWTQAGVVLRGATPAEIEPEEVVQAVGTLLGRHSTAVSH